MVDYKAPKNFKRYAEIFRLVLQHSTEIPRVTFWGVTDRTSWLNHFPIRNRVNHPLLFDRQGREKPAFHAVAQELRVWTTSSR